MIIFYGLGCVIAGLCISFGLFKMFSAHEANAIYPQDSHVGRVGIVAYRIRPGLPGTVLLDGMIGKETLTAYSDRVIDPGERVEIVNVGGVVVHVKRYEREGNA